ncbi:O-antigen ligase family protein [Chitinophaga niabensis]|uniref:O-antigen ligase family protein n=1 Tax=Chitinophaga niabensis TaxID=536979 RepID=UPI0031BB9CB1
MFIKHLKYHRSTIIICLICWVIFLITANRAFVAGSTLSLIFLYLTCNRFRIGKLKLISCLIFLAIILLVLSTIIDPDSSRGRLLIYKISLPIWKDHFFSGIGPGKFASIYNIYQAEYFGGGLNTSKELLLADNTYYAFNDYLQFVVEYGIAGIIALVVYFWFLIELVLYLIRNKKEDLKSTIFFTSQIITISFAAFFTHIYENPIIWCILISAILTLVLTAYKVSINKKYSLPLLFSVNILVLSLSNWEYIINKQAYNDWKDARILSETGAITASLLSYKKAYNDLHQNYEFLLSYGNSLQELHHFSLALEIYTQASIIRISNSLLDNIATCHQKLGNLNEAESFFLRSIFTVPNRFKNRYHLFNFYLITGQMEKASICGNSILSLPVKIPSIKIDEIRMDVIRKLNKIGSNGDKGNFSFINQTIEHEK